MSTLDTATRLGRELRAICGAEHVIEDSADLRGVELPGMPAPIAVWPGSPDEVSAILRLANEHGLNVVPAGVVDGRQTAMLTSATLAASKRSLQSSADSPQGQSNELPAAVDVLLSTSRLTAVEHYDPGDLTIGIGAGCTIAQLTSMVAADNLLFAGDSARPERATVGGLLATGLPGPLRHGYGGLRDYCIGIKFVTGDGRIAKGGGRVVKNVAGYDLMKLLIGSQGTLGIITGAGFKLFPAPRQTCTFVAEFSNATEALGFRDLVLRSPLSPMCLELVSPKALGRLRPENSGSWLICVRGSGSDAILARYRSELGSSVVRELQGETETQWWRAIADFPLDGSGGPEMAANASEFEDTQTFAISAPLQQIGPTIERLQQSDIAGVSMVGRVGVGHLLVSARGLATPLNRLVQQLTKALPPQASLLMAGRCLTTPTDLGSMGAVKHALDPNDILNRGRFLF